jgi:hypothetical protein
MTEIHKRDGDALDEMADMLDGREWDSGHIERVAELIRQTGRAVREPVSAWTVRYAVIFVECDATGAPLALPRRQVCEGTMIYESDAEEAEQLMASDSDALLDVDFLSPGSSYSASNRSVVGAGKVKIETPPEGWVFEIAYVLSVEEYDGSP